MSANVRKTSVPLLSVIISRACNGYPLHYHYSKKSRGPFESPSTRWYCGMGSTIGKLLQQHTTARQPTLRFRANRDSPLYHSQSVSQSVTLLFRTPITQGNAEHSTAKYIINKQQVQRYATLRYATYHVRSCYDAARVSERLD